MVSKVFKAGGIIVMEALYVTTKFTKGPLGPSNASKTFVCQLLTKSSYDFPGQTMYLVKYIKMKNPAYGRQ